MWLTCALRAGNIRTSLIIEKHAWGMNTGFDCRHRVTAVSMSSIIGKCEWALEGTIYRGTIQSEHGEKVGIPRNCWANCSKWFTTWYAKCYKKKEYNHKHIFLWFPLISTTKTKESKKREKSNNQHINLCVPLTLFVLKYIQMLFVENDASKTVIFSVKKYKNK